MLHEGRGMTTATGYQYVELVHLLLSDGWSRFLSLPQQTSDFHRQRYLQRGIETPLNASLRARRVGKLRNSEKGSDILPPRVLTSRE
jgi:hypothetical protein